MLAPLGAGLSELARLLDILAQLAPADRAFLELRVLPRWLLRRQRMALRNELIREARRRFFVDPRATIAARQLARALAAYALAGWRWECTSGLPPAASERHRALYEILVAGGGRVLGWRRIADVIAIAEIDPGNCNCTVAYAVDAAPTEAATARPGNGRTPADCRGSTISSRAR